MPSKVKEPKEPDEVFTPRQIIRTPAGLRNSLYDLWDDFSYGRIQASRVLTFVRLAGEINKTTVVELMVRKYTLENPSAPPIFNQEPEVISTIKQ